MVEKATAPPIAMLQDGEWVMEFDLDRDAGVEDDVAGRVVRIKGHAVIRSEGAETRQAVTIVMRWPDAKTFAMGVVGIRPVSW